MRLEYVILLAVNLLVICGFDGCLVAPEPGTPARPVHLLPTR